MGTHATTHPSTHMHELPPGNLTLNPKLDAVPTLHAVLKSLSASGDKSAAGDLDGELSALYDSLDRVGIQEPIKAHRSPCGDWIVDDGRHRLQWALDRGTAFVPVVEVSPEAGDALVEATVIGRRHWTKGQRAYLGVLLHPEVSANREGRPAKNSDSVGVSTATALAARLGVSADLVDQAAALYRKFYSPGSKKGSPEAIEAADLRAKYEMSIWAGAGLGAVLAGIGGGEATHGRPKPAMGFHGLDKPLATLTTFAKTWTKWSDEERAKAHRLMVARFRESFTPDFRLALSEALAAAEG